MTFSDKLLTAIGEVHSTLCVGLDPNLALLPEEVKQKEDTSSQKVEYFLKKVIDATGKHCVAYKPNLGFFEALGADGWDCFQEILDYIPSDKIVIADAKRGDISSTAEHYAQAFFNAFDVDAVTLNPLMGFETLDPFLKDPSKGIYVLTLTSNPGADDLLLRRLSGGKIVSTYIADKLSHKQQDSKSSIGMVVGATKAAKLQPVINNFTEAPLLIPGIGAQGGSVTDLAEALKTHEGIPLINSSRSIIYAGRDSRNWKQQVAEAASNTKEELHQITQSYV